MTISTAKKAKARKASSPAKLPVWDLSDLYPGMNSPELKADLSRMEKEISAFARAYEGKVEKLTADALAQAVQKYERIQDVLGRIGSYAQLVFAGDMTDPKNARFHQDILEKITALSTEMIFFTLALNRIADKTLEAHFKASPKLAKYRPWFENIRSFRPYQLSDDLEKLLHEKSVTSSAALVRLYDETLAALEIPVGGKKLALEEAITLLSDKDQKKRKTAAKALGGVFEQNAKLCAFVTNTLAKDKAIEDAWRGFKRPISSRNVANFIEDEVADALIKAVKDSYPRLSHRYYALKATWMGQKKLDYWDRNAPLPEDKDKTYSWPEATQVVLDAYGRFSPQLRKLGQQFFENDWIDVPARKGKASGAFAHPTTPSAHPYLLLNYLGKTRDVMTLAHELGHGVHQLLAARQGALMADTPLTLAETASVFGEQLTFQAMLAAEKDKKRRRAMVAHKVEDMLNTVVRQIAFCEFERKLHDERKNGELPVERICELWLSVQSESLGPALRFDTEYKYYWTYISHFIHAPFYVYAYAFGDCLVNALYAVYQEGHKGFEDKYFAMLSAGGTLHHKELLKPFGLDASKPAFWQKGLGVIERFIDELEE